MAYRRVLISGFPEGTTEEQLQIHFQSRRRSGGGDISAIEMREGEAVITFEEEVAQRVCNHPNHYLRGNKLKVSLVIAHTKPFQGAQTKLDGKNTERTELCIYPKSPVRPSDGLANSPQRANTRKAEAASCQVSVRGFPREASEDSLLNYFENERRSHGGPVTDVKINPELNMAVVTFESAADAERVLKFEHLIDKQPITVSFLEEEGPKSTAEYDKYDYREGCSQDPADPDRLHLSVSFEPLTTEDTIRNYFENARKSGGGEIEQLNFFAEECFAEIIFVEVADSDRLLNKEHSIGDQILAVERQEPEAKMPIDERKLYVEGLNPDSRQKLLSLKLYLEKHSDVDVKDVQFGRTNENALVTFESPPDIDRIIENVSNDTKGLEGFKPLARRAPVSCSVLVTGLPTGVTEEIIALYFESTRKSGGGEISRLEYHDGSESAIVYFKDPAAADNVLKQSDHFLLKTRLTVNIYHPLLEDGERQQKRGSRRKRRTTQRVLHMDHDIIAHLKMSHRSDLEDLRRRLDATITLDETTNTVVISPFDQGGNCPKPWVERERTIEEFLNGVNKIYIDLDCSEGVADEVQKQMHETGLFEKWDQVKIVFANSENSVQFIGRETDVSQVINEFQELVRRIEEDFQLKKSVTQNVDKDFPREKLRLLELSGFCQELEKKRKHLKISVDTVGSRLVFDGPEVEIGKSKTEILKFLMTPKELVLELPRRRLRVLFSPGGRSWVQESFQERSIVAILSQREQETLTSNEVVILGLTNEHAREAKDLLREAFKEFSLTLEDGQDQVILGQSWEDFLFQVKSPSSAVDVSIEINKLWVSGVSDDVFKIFQEVRYFLEKNTILSKTITMPRGCTRFLMKYWREKVESITRMCSVKWNAADELEGLELSGNAESLTKCTVEMQSLISSVQYEKLSIDKPGMGTLFSKGSVAKVLKGVEEVHHCTIERNDNLGTSPNEVPLFEENSPGSTETKAVCTCTFTTPEGKKISVYKDDLTKHQADAIVNAANGQLRHEGALAAAIVNAGGREIQEECDKYIQTRGGPLLDGQIYTSRPGKLPCKHIIHAVGPKWNAEATKERNEGKKTTQEIMLAYAITNCLEKASSLWSIAIPAVSSGVYGFPLDLCASVIIDTVVEFFEANPTCRLSEVHLTNINDATVAQFTDEMRTRFGTEHSFHERGKPTASKLTSDVRLPLARESKPAPKQYLTTAEGVKISVRAGDLTMEKADVLVGSCGSTLVLNNNPCAKALSQAAGAGLQRECSTKGAVKEGNIAKAGPHNLRCKAVYFGVCSPWNSGNGEKVLSGLFKKCLTEAHQSNMASIAFSSIGTGQVLQFPCDAVAKIYFEQAIAFSNKHPNTTLKDIRFIPFDKDIPTVRAFTDELSRRTPGGSEWRVPEKSRRRQASSHVPMFSAVKERDASHLELTVGNGLRFEVQEGDITQERTDAIAVMTTYELNLKHCGGAGAAILRKGGTSIQEECARHGKQSPGSVVVTGPGNLPCNQIFHIVPKGSSQAALEATVLKCLQKAELNNITSISFPAVGTGNIGVNAEDCAKLLLASVEKFSQQNPQSVRLVKIIVFQRGMVDEFRSVMETKSTKKAPATDPGIIAKVKRVAASYLCRSREDESSSKRKVPKSPATKISLEIFAGNRRDLDGAIKEISDIMDEHCKQKPILNQALTRLSEEQENRIKATEFQYDIKVQIEKVVGRIVVRGTSDDILNVTGLIQEIIDEIKEEERKQREADMLVKYVKWEYREEERFVQYPTEINLKIETAHAEKKQEVTFSRNGEYYIINLARMEQNSLENRFITDVRRRDARDVAVPGHWDPQPLDVNGVKKEVHEVELDPNTDEYRRVEQEFQNSPTPHGLTIISIKRIQNPGLNGLYETWKAKMDEGRGSNEKKLFHGTAGTNITDINAKGLNRSYAGTHAVMYGKGVYFAFDPSYSARTIYSPPDQAGLRYMYLAKVLVGEYTVGKRGMLVPPNRAGDSDNPTDTYDTVVDQIPNPSIVVTFYDWQCYPEYLITFK